MKKLLLTTAFFAIFLSLIMAQIPQAFKYQAVVRDHNGTIIADQNINLRISILFGDQSGDAVYSETHPSSTNGMGLVNLEIGRGFNPTNDLSDINWAEGNYFIRIEMDEYGGSDFKPMGVAQLLSVPYALHSGTAESITGNEGDGVPANNWILFGNSNTDPTEDKLGTTDNADLVMVTNDLERLRIKSDGDVEIVKSLNIGLNLTVEQNVSLNTVGGATNNYGPFTVANLSPTLLSGTLTVDLHTDLNSSLNVDGVTDLNSAFNVNNASPSVLTGILHVDENATFYQHVTLENALLQSIDSASGALVVKGGVGIMRNLNVGGDAKIGGDMELGGILNLTFDTVSTSTTTGTLIVAGGVGIGRQLNVAGATEFESTLVVHEAAIFNSTVAANGQVTINANPGTHKDDEYDDYPLQVEGGEQGIAIKVNGSRGNSNNYVSFWDESGSNETMQGRIEGETSAELLGSPEYIVENVIFGTEILAESMEVLKSICDATATASSSTACVGLGACVTTPIPSLIIGAIAKVVMEAAKWILLLGEPIAYNVFLHTQIGVTYQSGAGDYAEWLIKEDVNELFYPGEIVGVTHGRISKVTDGAEKVMVISLNPIVLGNMPEEGKENEYEKVAFMGQVPVKVFGDVTAGDYILPSGTNNGFGIAVHPDDLGIDEYSKIVGIAWSGSNTGILGTVNVAVGLNTNDLAKVVSRQEEEIADLKRQINRMYEMLEQLIPELKDSFIYNDVTQEDAISMNTSRAGNQYNEEVMVPVEDRKVYYYKVTKEQVIEGFELAERMIVDHGVDIDTHPFFVKIKTEPGYKEEYLNNLQNSINTAIDLKVELDRKAGYQTEIIKLDD